MNDPTNRISFDSKASEIGNPAFEGLSGFEVDDLRKLRRAAGNIALSPTQAEIQAHEEALATRNYEFVSSIPELLPNASLTVEATRKRAGDFGHGAKLVLHDIDFEFVNRERGRLNQDLAGELSALRAGVIWLETDFDHVMSAKMTKNHHDNYFTNDTKKLLAPFVIAGTRVIDNTYSEVMCLPVNHMSQTDSYSRNRDGQGSNIVYEAKVYNDRWPSLSDRLSLYSDTKIIIAKMKTKQLHDLEALQSVMLGEGLSQDELKRARRDGDLVVSPDTIPVFTVRDRSKKTLRFHKGPSTPSAIETEDFDVSILTTDIKAIPSSMFKDFAMMRWLHRTSVFFGKEDEFTARAKQFADKMPEDPVSRYLRENS
jgi:hypothetical protein